MNFFSFRLESPIHAVHGPQISVFGGFYLQSLVVHRLDLQKALPLAERRVLSPHWSRSDAQCDLWPWQRNQKRRKDSGKLAICPDHPRRRIDVKVCMPGGLRCIVLYFKFLKIVPVVLPLWMVENCPFPLLWPLAYTTACTTVQAVISYPYILIASEHVNTALLWSTAVVIPRRKTKCFMVGGQLRTTLPQVVILSFSAVELIFFENCRCLLALK